jgi:hypothetical protein
MADPDRTQSQQQAGDSQNDDLEKADHAVLPPGDAPPPKEDFRNSEKTHIENDNDEPLSRQPTDYIDYEDPFALFPALSVSMSSTQGPRLRRNTVTTLGRPLTREETMQTLRTVRSRYTDVRSEFDQHVCDPFVFLTQNPPRTTYQNSQQLMKTS